MDTSEFNAQVIDAFRASHGRGEFGPVHFDRIALLTTRGRRTGAPHTVPIGALRDGDDIILLAANMGAPKHPEWYLNLEADPHVHVELTERSFDATARITAGEEREDALAKWIAAAPHVASYEEQAGRPIPMVKVRVG